MAVRAVREIYPNCSSLEPWVRGLIYVALLATSALLAYTNISRGLMDDERFRYALLFAILVISAQFWPLQTPRRRWAHPGHFVGGCLCFACRRLSEICGDYPSRFLV